MDRDAVALQPRDAAARTPALLAGEGVGQVDMGTEKIFSDLLTRTAPRRYSVHNKPRFRSKE